MMHVVKTGWDWDSYVTSRVGVEATISNDRVPLLSIRRTCVPTGDAECHEVDRIIMAPL